MPAASSLIQTVRYLPLFETPAPQTSQFGSSSAFCSPVARLWLRSDLNSRPASEMKSSVVPSAEKSEGALETSPLCAVMLVFVPFCRSMSQMSESLVVRDLTAARYRLSREIGPRSNPSVLR